MQTENDDSRKIDNNIKGGKESKSYISSYASATK
jgi:hypothetical protein